MSHTSSYVVMRERDGSYRLHCTTPPLPRVIAMIAPVSDRGDQVLGWRLKPLVVMHGARSRIWTTPAEAITATKLMTPGQAKAAIRAADAQRDAPPSQPPPPRPAAD